MNRREFTGILAGGIAGSMLPAAPRPSSPLALDAARLNRHIKELSSFGTNPQGGVSRVAFSDADRAGRAWVIERMKAAGLDVSVDVAANIFGRRAGTDPRLKPIVFGSHIDSVPDGGNFDGPVGSLGAIEVARTLAENRIVTRHPLLVTIFANEEGGLFGSRAITTGLPAEELGHPSSSGMTIREGIRFIGGDPDKLDGARLR